MTKEEMFNKNIRLAYKIANKYRANYSEEFEDIKQLALIGLWKAVTRYNDKNALSTFAYVVIQNEINLYLRKIKKSVKIISMNAEIEDNLTLGDMLQAEDGVEELLDYIEQKEIEKVLNEVLESKNETYQNVYELYRQGYRQHQIAEMVEMSQANVSRIISKINKKVSERIAKI